MKFPSPAKTTRRRNVNWRGRQPLTTDSPKTKENDDDNIPQSATSDLCLFRFTFHLFHHSGSNPCSCGGPDRQITTSRLLLYENISLFIGTGSDSAIRSRGERPCGRSGGRFSRIKGSRGFVDDHK